VIQAELIAFYLLSAIAIASALGMLWVKNVLNAALLLILCLLAVAGVYAVLNAEFIAVAQIMIYAGGVLVLILFGIMITVHTTGKVPEMGTQNQWLGLIAAAGFFLLLAYCLPGIPNQVAFNSNITTTQSLGVKLITSFAAPFEVSGLLLLVSLIGAALVASYRQRHE